MKDTRRVVPVGWYRVAVATQLLLEITAGSVLHAVLRAVLVGLSYKPELDQHALELFDYVLYFYYAAGAVALCYIILAAKPPTEESFAKSRWNVSGVTGVAGAPVSAPAPRRRARGEDWDSGSSGANLTDGTLNPANGLPMMGGIDIAGNTYGAGSSDDFSSSSGSGFGVSND